MSNENVVENKLVSKITEENALQTPQQMYMRNMK